MMHVVQAALRTTCHTDETLVKPDCSCKHNIILTDNKIIIDKTKCKRPRVKRDGGGDGGWIRN